MVHCNRCHKDVEGTIDGPMSSGVYVDWVEFMDSEEHIICDSCMWSDPRYIKVYGKVNVSTQE
jgi:hypothetical protein